jgi:hypothetical protein
MRHTSTSHFLSLLALLALLLPAPSALSETVGENDGASEQASTTSVASAAKVRLPIYQPPKVGKPARTVGGGSRGPGDGIPELYVLVPDHVGQTASEQPSLFWYVDEVPKSPTRIDFTLLDEDGIDPLVQVSLGPINRAGIQRIQLSDYGVKLEKGIEYEWSVSLVPDAKERAKDIVSTGWIDRVAAPSDLDSELAASASASDKAGAVYVFASKGLWYDALAALDEQIQAQPGDKELSAIRAALLQQVGLDDVAKASL